MSNELAAALNEIISQAAPVRAAEPSVQDAFASLLAGTSPEPAPRYSVRCPRTGGVYAFVRTAAEAEALAARLAA